MYIIQMSVGIFYQMSVAVKAPCIFLNTQWLRITVSLGKMESLTVCQYLPGECV